MTSTDWITARALARQWRPLARATLPLRGSVGAVTADDAIAPTPVPHYDSAAMDGWAVAGPPPWILGETAVEVVTGAVVPGSAEAVVPTERATIAGRRITAEAPARGVHIRRAGEEAAAGTVLVPSGVRLTAAHVAMLGIAGLDRLQVRERPTVALVLTGDGVLPEGRPAPGRVRDAFDPMLPAAVERLGGRVTRVVRVGDDAGAIRAAIDGPEQVVVSVGGTGRSRADLLRAAFGAAEVVFDGVAMRPGHPTILVKRPRPLLGLPGNPLAAVAGLLSFLPPVLDGLTGAAPSPTRSTIAAVRLPGWAGGTSLLPCAVDDDGLRPVPATRPNMLRGLAVSDAIAVVPPGGVRAGARAETLQLPW